MYRVCSELVNLQMYLIEYFSICNRTILPRYTATITTLRIRGGVSTFLHGQQYTLNITIIITIVIAITIIIIYIIIVTIIIIIIEVIIIIIIIVVIVVLG